MCALEGDATESVTTIRPTLSIRPDRITNPSHRSVLATQVTGHTLEVTGSIRSILTPDNTALSHIPILIT